MNYVHFTFENIFDYKSTLEQIPKANIMFADYIANINSLQLSFDYKYTLVPYQDFIASICNFKYTVTTTTMCTPANIEDLHG